MFRIGMEIGHHDQSLYLFGRLRRREKKELLAVRTISRLPCADRGINPGVGPFLGLYSTYPKLRQMTGHRPGRPFEILVLATRPEVRIMPTNGVVDAGNRHLRPTWSASLVSLVTGVWPSLSPADVSWRRVVARRAS